ncbi:hypothetical protein ONS95_001766 [Cadophora gregata]|uniref:uncharacterized protein n=1 Tax=Cadophora gregata TaxID=51156 RepID=UPI0026DBA47D|nr:uncharacterized protein ONS95_001766 [Cadophora gregata]KAK0111406.1 hypothetical protein ONS95_001766 [Cadophora gregata]KAK0112117.1 hypothetical protein ONS96_001375 [Cadophora gregata f. sp. sojae]
MSSSPAPSPADPANNTSSPELTPSERAALMHWSLYGQGHDSDLQRLKPRTAPPTRQKPISKPVSAPWNVPLSPAQMANLRRGFSPQEMEDKWFIYSRDGDDDQAGSDGGIGTGVGEDSDEDVEEDSGTESSSEKKEEGGTSGGLPEGSHKQSTGPEIMRLFMVRSWTGNLVYIIRILVLREESRSGGKKEEGDMEGRILGIVWETDEERVRGQSESVAKESAREVCRWILGVQLLPDVPAPRRGKVQRGGSETENSQ